MRGFSDNNFDLIIMPYRQDSRFPLSSYYSVFYASSQEIFENTQKNTIINYSNIYSSFNLLFILSIAEGDKEIPYRKSSERFGV